MTRNLNPPVWQMVSEAVETLGGKTTNVAVRDWILKRYPGTNKNTIQCQIIVCTVNHDSRVHYPENSKPRKCNTPYDFLYRPQRGQIEFYQPERHGLWEIYKREDGKLGVRRVDHEQSEERTEQPAEVSGSTEAETEQVQGDATFAAEPHLRDYLAKNLGLIEPGLELFVDDRENVGVEYRTAVGNKVYIRES